jgi:hypothetical protein
MSLEATYIDAFNMLCGDLLGEGCYRRVFKCKLRPDLVVKVESAEIRSFMNVAESRFWSDNEHYKKIADWLAPCEFLSPDGRILLQRKVDPVPDSYKLPEKLPSFLTDHKRANFGILDGRLVCVDYATTIPNLSVRPKKAWW